MGSVEKVLDHVVDLQVQMVDLLKGQQEQLNQQQQHINLVQHQIDRMQRNLESMNRFNIQTRRLWILIARKANWLDEDDLSKWEQEDL